MTKQYKIIKDRAHEVVEKEINRFAKEGWRPIEMVELGLGKELYVLLEREED